MSDLYEKASYLLSRVKAKVNAPSGEAGMRVIGFKIDTSEWLHDSSLHYPIDCLQALEAIAKQSSAHIERIEALNESYRDALRLALGAISAAYMQADAEHCGHDKMADRNDKIVRAARDAIFAALASATPTDASLGKEIG